MEIILASASPRRKHLMQKFGFIFKTYTIEVPELDQVIPSIEHFKHPWQIGVENAVRKGKAVFDQFPNALVISADTIVVIDGKILGKPKTVSDAKSMLNTLSGRKHQVITGIALYWRKRSCKFYSITDVYFRSLADYEIEFYVKTKEPLDKAGAYGIQGLGGAFVECISGCYYNVVGLPIPRLIQELRNFDVDIFAQGSHKEE